MKRWVRDHVNELLLLASFALYGILAHWVNNW